MKLVNPSTERVIKNIVDDDWETVKAKHQMSVQSQQLWVNRTIEDRLVITKKFNLLLAKHLEKLAEVLTREMGKPINQSRNEILGARSRIDYFLENSERLLMDETMYEHGNMKEVISYEPLGIIANISAWNYPYLVGVNVFIPAIIAGNAVLYKPSEYASLTGQEMQKLWQLAGLPKGVFQSVMGGSEAGKMLLDLPLNGYFFTGSHQTGNLIYQSVAQKMVPCQLELGGKDPLYVSANNENLRQVAKAVLEGVFYNNGQSCCAVERIYVHRDIYHDFINLFVQEVKQLKMGDPEDEAVFIGPVTRKEQLSFLLHQVEDAVAKGGKVLSGGKIETRQGYYFQPTVIINTSHDMDIMTKESFGPVIGIQEVHNDDEAVALMNDTNYGLTASIYSDDQQQALDIMAKMDAGTVYWNCSDRVSPRLPWSGRKHSGFGSTLSEVGIRVFTKPKAYQMRSKL
jgi:acyl-CoA reductase-like NAD-dependent aldehyde dehydrogenase